MEVLHRAPNTRGIDNRVSSFINARSRMFAAAFRRLGSAAEAEDVVQDVWLRWQKVDHDVVRNAPAFLATTSARLAINRAKGARTRGETSLELCAAEPVDPEAGPAMQAERSQALASALSLLLERLSPLERAAYLLREAFNYSYRQIAIVLRINEANSRQLVTRARKRLIDGRRATVDATALRRMTVAFVDAMEKGDLAGLEALLSANLSARVVG